MIFIKKRVLLLLLVGIIFCINSAQAQCTTCNKSISGSSWWNSDYNGQIICVQAGQALTSWGSINHSNVTIVNCGTMNLSWTWLGGSYTIENYGTITHTGSLTVSGITLINKPGGVITTTGGDLELGNNGTLNNYGTINVNGTGNSGIHSGFIVVNAEGGIFNYADNLNIDGSSASLTNNGTLNVTGSGKAITIISHSNTVINNSTINAYNLIINGGTLTNNCQVTVNNNIDQEWDSRIYGPTDARVGRISVAGISTINGGTFGGTNQNLDFCDAGNPTNHWDNKTSATIAGNITYCTRNSSCSACSSFARVSASNTTICSGASTSLTATGGTSYVWNTSATTATISVSPTTTTTYSVTATQGSCSEVKQIVITVQSNPTANAGADVQICNGASTILTATGGTTYQWSNSINNYTNTVSPTATTTYIVTANLNGCTASDNVVVTVNAKPTADAGTDATICHGASTILTASGGGTYQWNTSATTQQINISPSSTTTYTVTVTGANTCTASDNVVVTVNASPTANAGTDVSICEGGSTNLTATGGDTYEWSTTASTQQLNVSPSSTITYTVTVTGTNTCTASDNVIVTVNAIPTAQAGNDISICNGQSTILTAAGGGTYEWSTSSTTQQINVSPSSTTSYTVTSTTNNCTSTDEVVVSVNASPTANAGADQAICKGTSISLTATGGDTYEWNTTASTQQINVSPSSTSTYTVTVTSNNCTATDNVIITVNESVANAGADRSICTGTSTSLNATGGNTYIWSTGATTQQLNISPSSTTTYTVTTTNNNCSSTDAVVVTVTPGPCITCDKSISGSNWWNSDFNGQVICIAEGQTLTSWGSVNHSNVKIINHGTISLSWSWFGGSYTIENYGTITHIGNLSISVITFINKAEGTITITGDLDLSNNGTFTNYGTTHVNGTGASGVHNGFNAVNAEGGVLSYAGNFQIDGSNTVFTNNGTLNVTGSGMTMSVVNISNLVINNSIINAYNFTVNTGYFTNNCQVNVSNNWTQDGPSYVYGPTDTRVGKISVVGISTFNYGTFGGANQALDFCDAGNPTDHWDVKNSGTTVAGNITYCTRNSSCTACTSFASISAASSTICHGASTDLTVSGGTTYIWSTSSTTQQINVSPLTTTTYYVTATQGNCTEIKSIVVTVHNLPTANAGTDVAICSGASTNLVAAGGSTFEWNTNETTQQINVSPSSTTTYTVTANLEGCTASDEVVVTVNPLPTIDAGSNVSISLGQSTTLTPSGGDSYLWSTEETTNLIDVSPIQNTYYLVTGTDVNGCKNKDSVLISLSFSAVGTLKRQSVFGDLGSIKVEVAGGVPPYTYIWDTLRYNNKSEIKVLFMSDSVLNTFGINVDSLLASEMGNKMEGSYRNNLHAGIYNVLVVDSLQDTVRLQYKLGIDIIYFDSIGVTVESNTLTKVEEDGWDNTSVVTLDYLPANDNGLVQFQLSQLNAQQIVGFRLNDTLEAYGRNNIRYGLFIKEDTIKIWENNVLIDSIGIYHLNDILSIERIGDTLFYKQNNINLRSIQVSPLEKYQVVFNIYSNNAQIKNIYLISPSSWTILPPNWIPTLVQLTCVSPNSGSITFPPEEGNSGTFNWIRYNDDGTIDNSFIRNTLNIKDLKQGKYVLERSFTINYHKGRKGIKKVIRGPFYIGYKAVWENLVNTTANENTLIRTSVFSRAHANGNTINKLITNGSGWFSFTLNNGLVNCGLSSDLNLSGFYPGFQVRINEVFVKKNNVNTDFLDFIEWDNPKTFIVELTSDNKVIYSIEGSDITKTYVLTESMIDKNAVGIIWGLNNRIENFVTSFPCSFEGIGYAELNKKLDGAYYNINNGILHFKYNEDYVNNQVLHFNIYDENNEDITGSCTLTNSIVKTGLNLYDLNVSSLVSGYYVLEVINSKDEKLVLRFKK